MRIFILAIFMILVSSCQFPDLPEHIEVQIHQKMKAFCLPIGEGATYIYVDTTSGELDTMILENVDRTWNFYEDFKMEYFLLDYKCTNTPDFHVRLSTNESFSEFQYFGLTGMASHKITINFDENIFYPTSTNVILDSMTILDNTYYQVLENSAHSLEYERFIFAKGVGIILKESNPGFGQSFHRTFVLQKVIHP